MHLELIRNEPAVLLQEGERRVLVIGDLHIGYERTLLKQDYYSTNLTARIIDEVRDLVKRIDPSEIVILGDLKHTIREFSKQEFQQVAQLLAHLQDQASVTIVRGNHDADLELVVPDDTQICSSSGFYLRFKSKQVYLLHGHASPSSDMLSCDSLLMGHIHPAVSISKLKEKASIHRVWIKTSWKPSIVEAMKGWVDEKELLEKDDVIRRILRMKILVIPAYLSLLRGHVLNLDSSNKHLGTPLFRHLSLDNAEIIMLDHTPLGSLEDLKK